MTAAALLLGQAADADGAAAAAAAVAVAPSPNLGCVGLLAAHLAALTPISSAPGWYLWGSQAVRRAEVLGIVVFCDRRAGYVRFAVDDGSGCAPVVLWLHPSVEPTPLGRVTAELAAQVAVGRIVRAQGRVTCYRGQLQLTASSLQAEAEDCVEVHHWLNCMRAALRSCHPPLSLR
eukprot:SM000006S19521  [mRNA]  locus=s6:1210685:1211700:- [translate_table: standard]